ncbi:MAG: hypothetical protein WDN26_14445 [Chitinophagaceae bacterium]
MKKTNPTTKWLTLLCLLATIIFNSCQKEMKNQPADNSDIQKSRIKLPETTNPFSLRNVEKAKATLGGNNYAKGFKGEEKQFIYFKFNEDD